MIRLANLSFTYPGAKDKSLDGIDMTVQTGECVLVTGTSGCGKTTLTRVMNGLCPKFYGGRLEGEYLLDGRRIEDVSLDEIGSVLGSVFQDPRSQFFAKRVRDEVVLAMENHCISRDIMHERLWDVSEMLGISYLHDREMRVLSSGEKQKVAIASVCALQPKGLVLDEPSANLDSNAILQLAEFLRRMKTQGHTIIVSEHRLHYLRDVFDRLIIMREGKIAQEYSRKEALRLSQRQLEALGLRFFDVPELRVGEGVTHAPDIVLRANSISLRVNDTQILNDVGLSIAKGMVTAVSGSNGAGKTSLCRIMTGIQKESVGTVYVQGAQSGKKKRVRNSFFVQQDVDYQLYTPSVKDEILLGTKLSVRDAHVADTIQALGLDGLLHRHPNTLSGGQKQRVLLAAAVLRGVPAIVLDEPTSGLDGFHMRAVSRILNDLTRQGQSILLITHDMEFISLTADILVYMNAMKILYQKTLLAQET